MWSLVINSSVRGHNVCVHSAVCFRKCVEGRFGFIFRFVYDPQKAKYVYLKLHQMVFLTAYTASGSASRIQFEVITLGRKDA